MTVPTFSALLLSVTLAAGDGGKSEDHYSYGQLGVKQIRVVRGNRLEIKFKQSSEQHYWCPGAKTKDTKQGLVLTFVRCPNRKTCSVDIKAKIGRHLVQSAIVDPGGKDVYIRSGKQLKKIYSVEKATDKRHPKQNTPANGQQANHTGATTNDAPFAALISLASLTVANSEHGTVWGG